jgi:hypothetical protein
MSTRYDPEFHNYFIDEVLVPGATRVMGDCGITDNRFYKQEHRDRGSAVHDGCCLVDRDDWDEDSTSPAIVPYLKQYERFLVDNRINPQADILLTEEPLFSAVWRYGVTPDRVYRIREENWLVDFKSGGSPGSEIQLALQDIAVRETKGITIDKRIVLQLTDEGTYKIRTVPPGQYRNDDRVALSAVTVWWWRNMHGKL